MANLEELALQVRNAGYSEINSEAKVCQDIVLKAIANSSLSHNVTIKGGVVMRSITGNIRRATQDMDLDFIRYSLSEDSIRAFVSRLNCLEGITISITGDICFDVCLDEVGASLLINSKEQIFTEKLRSLLRFGPLSTRYKDVFDMCYLSDYVDKSRLQQCMATYIFSDPGMRENDMDGIMRRVNRTFSDRLYKRNIERAGNANWLEIGVPETFEKIETFLSSFDRDIQVRNCSSMCF